MARRTLIWSDPAENDLNEILRFYRQRNGNSQYGRKILTELRQRLRLVLENKMTGTSTEDDDVRYVFVDPFQIFFQRTATSVVVLRVWDARRNPDDVKGY